MKRIVSTVLLASSLCAFSASSQAHGTSLSISVGPHGGFGLSVGMPPAAIAPAPIMVAPPMPVVAPVPVVAYRGGFYPSRMVYPASIYYTPPVYRQRVIMVPAAGQRHHFRGARHGQRGY